MCIFLSVNASLPSVTGCWSEKPCQGILGASGHPLRDTVTQDLHNRQTFEHDDSHLLVTKVDPLTRQVFSTTLSSITELCQSVCVFSLQYKVKNKIDCLFVLQSGACRV